MLLVVEHISARVSTGPLAAGLAAAAVAAVVAAEAATGGEQTHVEHSIVGPTCARLQTEFTRRRTLSLGSFTFLSLHVRLSSTSTPLRTFRVDTHI